MNKIRNQKTNSRKKLIACTNAFLEIPKKFNKHGLKEVPDLTKESPLKKESIK